MKSDIKIRLIKKAELNQWLRMRKALWQYRTLKELGAEARAILKNIAKEPVFVAERSDGSIGGMVETGTRSHGEGCHSAPVGYIEGWYVDADLRKQGLGKQLLQTAEKWAASKGCREMASDTWLDKKSSTRAHLACGYVITDKLIHFKKKIKPQSKG
jgi:aminoglycoside 6'-N-acetyltransferase I